MKMKKILKIVVIVLVALYLLYLGTWAVIGQLNKDWMTFNNAAMSNDITTMENMLNGGYDINNHFKLIFKSDHLAPAVAEGILVKPETVEFLLKNGANPNYLGKRKVPLVIFATALKQPEKVKLLIQYGANLHAKSAETTLVDWAVATNQPEIIMMIPEDKIITGPLAKQDPIALERIIEFYNTGKTDERILNHWEKHGYFSKTYIDNIRKTKK